MIEIRLHELARRHRDVIARGRVPVRVGHHRFDRALLGFAELFAAAGKHLDAVVGIRVVGRRQHDAEIVVQRARKERDARRRQHARVGHRGAFAGGALSIPAARLVQSSLVGVGEHDPLTYAGVAVFIVLVASIASVLPALRILRLNPVEALR